MIWLGVAALVVVAAMLAAAFSLGPRSSPTLAVLAASATPTEKVVQEVPGGADSAVQLVDALDVGGAAVGPDGQIFVSVRLTERQAALLDVDPVSGSVTRSLLVEAPGDVHVAAGSVWLPQAAQPSAGGCDVSRYDARTLELQARVSVPCGPSGPRLASDGEALWFEDVSTSGSSAVFTRIDPDTNQPGRSVALPPGAAVDGPLTDGQALFFDGDTRSGGSFYRLTRGATAFERLSPYRDDAHPGGQGIWASSADGHAQYFTSPDAPDLSLAVRGSILVGDDVGLFVVRRAGATPTASGTPSTEATQVWRYSVDGLRANEVGKAPIVEGRQLSYLDRSWSVLTNDGLAQLWLVPAPDASKTTLYLQWMPLPD